MKKKIIALMLILSVSFIMASCGNQGDRDSNSNRNSREDESEYKDNDYLTPTKKQETNSADNEIEEAENYNSPLFDYVGDDYKDGSDNASDTYNSEAGFLYDGACFALYETMGESDDIVYIAERDGKLCISFDDINYIPLSYSEAKEGYDAYPSDDAESHIIIQEITVNGAFGIEIVSSGSYGKYYGEYIGIPDRDM